MPLLNDTSKKPCLVLLSCIMMHQNGFATEQQASQVNPVQQTASSKTSVQNTHKNNTQKTEIVQKRLTDIILDENFSDKKQIKVRKQTELAEPNENNWLIRMLELLFDWANFSGNVRWGMIFKGFFIIMLLLLIVWVVRRSDKLSLIIKNLKIKRKTKVVVQSYKQAHLSQGFEQLPEHQHIPKVVAELIQQQHLLPASSILYRGGLRWLNQTYQLGIQPATTEMQCIALLEIVHKSQSLPKNSSDFMKEIINTWLPMAYATNVECNGQHFSSQLHSFTTLWLQTFSTNTQTIDEKSTIEQEV